MSQIDLNFGDQMNKQAFALEDGMYTRRERQQGLDERRLVSEERLIDKRIELGRETMRVAAAVTEWRNGEGMQPLGQRMDG